MTDDCKVGDALGRCVCCKLCNTVTGDVVAVGSLSAGEAAGCTDATLVEEIGFNVGFACVMVSLCDVSVAGEATVAGGFTRGFVDGSFGSIGVATGDDDGINVG